MSVKLRELIDEYWSLAYAEGKGGRDHDTEAGDAQRVSCAIDDEIRRLAASHVQAGAVPDGWRLVPVEPTTEMLTAGSHAVELHSHSPRGTWSAMLAAAPGSAVQPAKMRMLTEEEIKAAWQKVREEVGTEGWSVAESANFQLFFRHGIRAAQAAGLPIEGEQGGDRG